MKRYLLLFSAALLLTNTVFAQNSQFFIAPQQVSPATTGFTPAEVRASFNYYSQHPAYSPNNNYQTGLLSVDAPLLRGHLPKGDALGVGVYHTFDMDDDGAPRSAYLGLSTAYHKILGAKRNQYVSAGVQGMISMRGRGYGFPMYNIGAMYTRQLASDRATVYGGLSTIGSLNYKGSEPIISIGGNWAVNARFTLFTNGLLMPLSWGYDNYLITAYAGYVLNKKSKVPTTIYAGGTTRYDDYFAPYIGIERWGLRLGITREFNISPSEPMWGGDAYEVSLQWMGRFKKKTEKLKDVKRFPRIY